MNENDEEYDYIMKETQGVCNVVEFKGTKFPSNAEDSDIQCIITIQKVEG